MRSNTINSNNLGLRKLKALSKYNKIFDFEYLLEVEYNALNSFLVESKGTILKKEKELERKIDSWETERRCYDDAPEPFEMFENEISESVQFSKLLNNSFFITSYSTFEKYFNELCVYCQVEENAQKNISSIKRNNGGLSYIEIYKLFIEDVIQVDLSGLNNRWIEIEKYRDIRNAIVHNNGILKKLAVQNNELMLFIKTNKFIIYDDAVNTVAINSIKFVSNFTELIKIFYSELLNEIYTQRKKL